METPTTQNLSGDLLEFQDHELCGLERRETDEDVHDPAIDVVLRRRGGVTFDDGSVARRGSLKRALAEKVVHERADIEPDLRPERARRSARRQPI